MKIIFMGTPEFAVPSLDILVQNGYQIAAVVTAPDSMGGRGGKQLLQSAIKKYALEKQIPVLQPEKLRSPEFLDALREINADIQIVVAFRMLPEVVWNMLRLGTFNLHGSLLPKYRGAAPINHAIINGDKETGVTSFKLQHAIDTGDVLIQRPIPIADDENAGSLHDKMKMIGAEVVLETVRMIEKGYYDYQKQNDLQATHAPKIFHETCKINLGDSAEKIFNFIRGLSPYPGAWLLMDDKEMKVLSVKIEKVNDQNETGFILTDYKKYLKIKCSDGYINVLQLKPEGKKLMTVSEFLNGCKVLPEKVD